MTSRERLMAAILHKQPDRVPISTYELVGWDENSWENRQESYRPLMAYIRQNTDCMYMTGAAMVNRYEEEHTHVERWREGSSTFIRTTLVTPKGDLTLLDRVDDGLNTAWHIEHLVKSDEDIKKYLSIPDDPKPVEVYHLKRQEERLGDKGILLLSIGDPLCKVAELFDFGNFTVRAFTDTSIFKKLLDKVYNMQLFQLEDMLKKGAGPLFRICGPEYATPPFLNPDMFHEYVCKYDKKLIQLIHDYGQYARIHCHGRLREVLPHIMELEADALDPVEAPPSGDIELEEVKKLYGDKLCLMGNLQLKDLEYVSADEMREITLECMKAGKPGGNFVIMPTACPINAPLNPVTERNYRIFIDTALEYGQY